MSLESYGVFLAASLLLWITPGQDTIYIIARSLSQGRLAGIISALGIGTGGLFHALLAATGVSIIILTSPILYLMVKILGGLYLIYLGGSALILKAVTLEKSPISEERFIKIYTQGVITNVLNPKVALFFIAFLPQFINSNSNTSTLLFLGLIFVIGGTIWCLIVAFFASSLSLKLGQSITLRGWFNKISGVLYIGLGLNILRAKV